MLRWGQSQLAINLYGARQVAAHPETHLLQSNLYRCHWVQFCDQLVIICTICMLQVPVE